MTVVFCGTHGIFAAPADSCETVFTGRASVAIAADTSISLFILRTKPRAWIAASSKEAVALIGAFDFAGWNANTGLAAFPIGAEVCVIANGVVGFNWVGAYTCSRIADADLMAVIQGSTNDGVTGLACGVFTVVIYSASVGIVTCGAIGLGRIVADPGFWDANAHVMALAERFTDHGV